MPSTYRAHALLLGLTALCFVGCDEGPDVDMPASSCAGKCDDVDASSSEEERALAALGLFEGTRASADPATAEVAELDFSKLDFTIPGVFTFRAYFPPLSDDEGDNVPQADLFQMNFELTPEQFETLFGLDAPAVELGTEDFTQGFLLYQQRATAQPLEDGGRHVRLDWDNANEEDTRRGSMDVELDASGNVVVARMTKQAKRRCLLVFSCGWDVVFDDELVDLQRQRSGLALRTDGFEIGRVTDRDSVQTAVDNPRIETFRDLVE